MSLLTGEGYGPAFGETLLRKAISRETETPLSMNILSGRVQDSPVLHVDDQNGKFSFNAGVLNQTTQCGGAVLSSGVALLYGGFALFSERERLS